MSYTSLALLVHVILVKLEIIGINNGQSLASIIQYSQYKKYEPKVTLLIANIMC